MAPFRRGMGFLAAPRNRSLPVVLTDGTLTYVWGTRLAYAMDSSGLGQDGSHTGLGERPHDRRRPLGIVARRLRLDDDVERRGRVALPGDEGTQRARVGRGADDHAVPAGHPLELRSWRIRPLADHPDGDARGLDRLLGELRVLDPQKL